MKVFELPYDMFLTTDQVADYLGCSVKTITRNIKRQPESRYYLQAKRNAQGGPFQIHSSWVEDYIHRTVIGAEVRKSKQVAA